MAEVRKRSKMKFRSVEPVKVKMESSKNTRPSQLGLWLGLGLGLEIGLEIGLELEFGWGWGWGQC